MMDLRGSHVVIIGGSSGMGLATAQLVKQHGATVTIASRSPEKLRHAVSHLGEVRTIVADLTNESDVYTIFHDLDRVDHVFISAGRFFEGKLIEADLDTFRSDVAQRFWGPLYVVRRAVPKMTHGSITFLTGQYGSRPAVGAVVTAAMFAAIETLAKGLALEVAPIRVNAVAPGLIDTPLLGEHREGAAKWAEETLLVKRMGLAEEVAQAVVLLMSNGFMTGEVLHIDGGGRLV
jgi:NAD(P)-dependent dehydrogenase (short-subunit alcohol dehydrogenase family)